MFNFQRFVILALTILIAAIFGVHSAPKITLTQAEIYLSNFGYLPNTRRYLTAASILESKALIKAIKEFQQFSGLNESGILDEKTQTLMSRPRCGVPDKIYRIQNRSKRFVLTNGKWPITELTYRIVNYPAGLSHTDVDNEIAGALKLWSEQTNLIFIRTYSEVANLKIGFFKGDHGDGDHFDGTGSTLAHAFFPTDGRIHFDYDEHWTINSPLGTNLFQVAVHEFGHALGLHHSTERQAVMAPYYSSYKENYKLHQDDIDGIKYLYGRRETYSFNQYRYYFGRK